MGDIVLLICDFVFLFFSFSVMGWCMEVVLKLFQYHRFINRGFLIGPYCPIYGSGAVLVTLSVGGLSYFESSYGMTFLISFVVCGITEYVVSYCMEKRFHARWWDYSRKPMNLNGRVWIGNLILFGIGGTVIIKVIDPVAFSLYDSVKPDIKVICASILMVLLFADYITSHFVMKLVKVSVENSEADDTEAISSEIRMLLTNKSVLHKRIADAYPDVVFRTEKIAKRINDIKAEMERIREDAEEKIDAMNERIGEEKENFIVSHQPAAFIKNDIIEKQEELIKMLESQDGSAEEIETAKEIIESKKEILKRRQKLLDL